MHSFSNDSNRRGVYRFVQDRIPFIFWAMLQAMWDLRPPTRDRTHVPAAMEAQNLNHWTFREVPHHILFVSLQLLCQNEQSDGSRK